MTDERVKCEIVEFRAENNMDEGIVQVTKIQYYGNGEWEFRIKFTDRDSPVALKISASEVENE